MKFTDARHLEQLIWSLRLAEFGRSLNRDRICQLADGWPPYSGEEAKRNNIAVNVNNLTMTRLAHDGRSIMMNGFLKPGNFFTARTDVGPKHKRQTRGVIVSREVNRLMKRSLPYVECLRSQFALQILHGIAPACWETQDYWCPLPLGVEDVLVPANTTLTMNNLPFIAIWRGYTAWELHKLTQGPNRDPGWNMPVVERAIEWADEQTLKAQSATWQQYWSPEKFSQRIKEDNGLYASDLVQTIDCFEFLYRDDSDAEDGWCRKVLFDSYGGAGAWRADYGPNKRLPDKNLLNDQGLVLYDSGSRKWASKLGEFIHWQFADLSANAPFKYHSVRSLGFMVYALCHLQNRLQCKFAEAVFETLLSYLRVKSLDEVERALKVELVSHGFIDESVSFLRPEERWQPNVQLAELGMNMYSDLIRENSSSYVQNQNFSKDRVERTRFQVMAEVNAMTTLVSSALQLAYRYQLAQYQEIFRRFCKPNSRDPDVREFRLRCLKAGVPEKMLVPEAWELEPERVMGSGNKTLEMAIAQQLMQWRSAYAPEGQQQILRAATLAITDDPGFTDTLVPETAEVSDSRHDAMISFGSLMSGGEVQFPTGVNLSEVAEVLIGELGLAVKRVLATGGMTTLQQLQGFQNVATHIEEFIAQIEQDQSAKERAKKYHDALGQLQNHLKAFAQRLQEQMQKQNGDGGVAAETKAKLASQIILARAKAQNTRESHADRTAQRQVTHEMELQQEAQRHAQELRFKAQEQAIDVAAKDLETASTIRRNRLKSLEP